MTQADHTPKSDRNRSRTNHGKSEKGSRFFWGVKTMYYTLSSLKRGCFPTIKQNKVHECFEGLLSPFSYLFHKALSVIPANFAAWAWVIFNDSLNSLIKSGSGTASPKGEAFSNRPKQPSAHLCCLLFGSEVADSTPRFYFGAAAVFWRQAGQSPESLRAIEKPPQPHWQEGALVSTHWRQTSPRQWL